MIVGSFVFIGFAIVALVFYIIEKSKAYTLKEVYIKTIVSSLFVLLGIYNLCISHSENIMAGIFVIIGLALGLAGDIFLDLKYVYTNKERIFTILGFIVFGLGHAFYITAMVYSVRIYVITYLGWFHALLPVVGSVVISIIILLLAKPMKLEFGEMKYPVFKYSICLFSTPLMALSISILLHFESTFYIMMLIGGVLFAISDLILSKTYFSEGHERPIDFVLNYSFYYAAQFVIAMSLLFI